MQSQTNLPLHHLENCFKLEILLLTIAHKHRPYIIEQTKASNFPKHSFKNTVDVQSQTNLPLHHLENCFKLEILLLTIAHKHRQYIIEQTKARNFPKHSFQEQVQG